MNHLKNWDTKCLNCDGTFKEEALKDGLCQYCREFRIPNYKIIILGANKAHKKELISRFVSTRINVDPLGVVFMSTHLRTPFGFIGLILCVLDFDKAHQILISSIMKGTQGLIIVYDSQDFETWNSVADQIENLNPDKVPMIIVDNCSVEKKFPELEVKIQPVVLWANLIKAPYFAVTPSTELIVNDAFLSMAENIYRFKHKDTEDPLRSQLTWEEEQVLEILERKLGIQINTINTNNKKSVGYRQEHGHIVELKLVNLGLTILPDALESLVHLQRLDLSYNKFRNIPQQIWTLNLLEQLDLEKNPLNTNDKKLANGPLDRLREYCQSLIDLRVFLSHKNVEFASLALDQLVNYLEQQKRIRVCYCERDLIGSIRRFMTYQIPQCHIVLFIATPLSIKSEGCRYELEVAQQHEKEILPIISKDIQPNDLNSLKISDSMGINLSLEEIPAHLDEIYMRLQKLRQVKRLFNKNELRIESILGELDQFIRSPRTKKLLFEKSAQINGLCNRRMNNMISNDEFIEEILKLLNWVHQSNNLDFDD